MSRPCVWLIVFLALSSIEARTREPPAPKIVLSEGASK